MDCSLPGSSVCGFSQARILEWVAISFSRKYFKILSKVLGIQARDVIYVHWRNLRKYCCSVAQSFLILIQWHWFWFSNPMDCSTPDLPVPYCLLEFAQVHGYSISDTIQPSHPLLSPSSPSFNLSQHQGLFHWISPSHQVGKVLELQLQHQSFQWLFSLIYGPTTVPYICTWLLERP